MSIPQQSSVESSLTQVLRKAANELGFEMSCTAQTGALLTVLAASKPGGRLLELGTGVGVGTSYIADGLIASAALLSVELNATYQNVAKQTMTDKPEVEFLNVDAADFLLNCRDRFDLIFADTWAGKFTHLRVALDLLKLGGLYVIDDLLPQPNWPEGHAPKVPLLLQSLANCDFLKRVEMDWDTGIAIYVRVKC